MKSIVSERIDLMKFFILFLSLILVNCGKAIEIEKGLSSYVELFEKRYNVKIHTTVKFGKTTLPVVGYCEDDGFNKTIVINREEFEKFTALQKENLMLHEFGHCEFNRDHTEEKQNFKGYAVPKSLMYPYVFNSFQIMVYSENKSEYLTELSEGN